jgi:hypothetical protein
MDWSNILTVIITALASTGGIGSFLHFKEAKRAKRIENDKAAADEWKELYNKSEEKCDTLGQKLDNIYVLFRQEQEKRQAVEIALARAELC